MALSILDIIARVDVEGMEKLSSDFNDAVKNLDLKSTIGPQIIFIQEQFTETIEKIKQQIASGTFDPSSLPLKELENNVNSVFKSLGLKTEKVFFETFTKLENDVDGLSRKLDAQTKTSRGINKDIAALSNEDTMAAQARRETGTKTKISFKDLKGATDEVIRLQNALKESPNNKKLEAELQTYTRYVAIYKENQKRIKELQDDKIKSDRKAAEIQQKLDEAEIKRDKFIADNKKKLSDAQVKLLPIRNKISQARRTSQKIAQDLSKVESELERQTRKSTKTNNENAGSLAKKATAAVSYYVIFNQLKRVFTDTLRTIFQLDKSMTEVAVVTSLNREEAWKLLGAYQNLAKTTGLATSEIAGVVTQFLRQGRSVADAMKLAEVAAKSAKVASISANDAVNFLTSAVNGFGLAASQSEEIADKFAAIAARSATSFQELALAMSKVAPTAKSAGVSVDFMMGVIAKGIETTREAPENIGTAFKTIFARMREVTDLGKAMEDGMNLNRVEKALASVGVPLRDVSGQFRNLENVLIEVGDKWETLTSVEQAYLATALAGSRQQPRLLAIFNDFARTKELIQISAEATGELANQHYEYMQGSEAALTNLKTAWEGLTMAFVDTGVIVALIQTLADTLNAFKDLFSGVADAGAYFRIILVGIGVALTGLGGKFLTNIMLTNLQFLATGLAAGAQKKLGKAAKMTKKEFNQLTLAEQQKIIADLSAATSSTTLIAALKAKALAAKKSAIAFGKLMIAMGPLILIAIGVAAAIAAIVIIANELSKGSEHFAKKVQKANKELAELSSKERDVKKLADRFKELNSKITNTKQELEEMASISESLSEYEFDGQTFNISKTDVTGKIVIDKVEYERFIAAVESKRADLLAQNQTSFQEAFIRDMEGTLENRTLMQVFEKIGYEYGVQFIESLGEGINENIEQKLKYAAQRAGEVFSPEQFTDTRRSDEGEWLLGAGGTLAAAGAGWTAGGGFLVGPIVAAVGGVMAGVGALLEEEFVDFDAYEAFIKSLLGNVTTTFLNLETTIVKITESSATQLEKTAQIFDAQADAYAEGVASLQEQAANEGWTDEVLEQSITFLGESMQDEAVLDDLINKKKIDAKVIATLSIDLNLEEISNLYNVIESMLPEGLGEEFLINFRENLGNAFNALFAGGDGSLIGEGFNLLKGALRSTGEFTEDEIQAIILRVSNMIKTLSTTEVAGLLKDQMDLATKIFDLPSKIAKGDFSSFAELVEQYGLDAAQGVLTGNEDALEEFFNTQNNAAIEQIDESINKIIQTASNLGRELTEAEKNEIAALKLMRGYYSEVATQQQLRNYRLGTAKELLKDVNDLLKVQNDLMDLGLGDTFLFSILDDLVAIKEEKALDGYFDQTMKDLDDLERFRGKTGPDNAVEREAAVAEALESLGLLIDAVTAKYNRQKKAIQARYKAEIDSIKDSHSERWSTIDYTNKLADAENKIVEARRRLAGLAISGVSQGTLEQAQKDLKKLQEERQKIIEEQMVEQAQKELEKQMNEELIQIQQELTAELSDLNAKVGSLNNILLGITVPGGRPAGRGDNAFAEDVTTLDIDVKEGLNVIGGSGEIVFLTTALEDLTRVIENNTNAILVADARTGIIKTAGGSIKNQFAEQNFIGINRV